MFPIFADGIIEIVPKPEEGIVDTDTIVVRGKLEHSNNDEIKIFVNNETEPYIPIKLNTAINGFYTHGVKLSKGSNRIKVYKNGNLVDETEVTYSEDRTFKKSLWGRIANENHPHNGEEQRAVYFYPGTRFDKIMESGANTRDSDNLALKFWKNFSGTSFYSKTIFTSPLHFPKDSTDTKGPGDPDQKCWSNITVINKMMNEISNANTNIVMFVYWGDNDETIGESRPLGYEMLPADQQSKIDNFAKIYAAPTYPETCNYYVEFDDAFCIQYTDNDFHMWNLSQRSVVPCQCRIDSDCNNPHSYCLLGACFNKCGEGELQCGENQKCFENLCTPTIRTGYPIWHHYYTHKPNGSTREECVEIYSNKEYAKSGIINNCAGE